MKLVAACASFTGLRHRVEASIPRNEIHVRSGRFLASVLWGNKNLNPEIFIHWDALRYTRNGRSALEL